MSLPARALFMIRPKSFGYNRETAGSNFFQHIPESEVQTKALEEFDRAVKAISVSGIDLEIVNDLDKPELPDAIFPNNWFTTHPNGTIVLYPMMTPNRRAERRSDILNLLAEKYGYTTTHDLTHHTRANKYLEGTGSLVFDHDQHVAFACSSPRTNSDVLLETCERIGYLPIAFESVDRDSRPIYHTNVMLSIGENIAICCFESIIDKDDRNGIEQFLRKTGKLVIPINLTQMEHYAANVLFCKNKDGIQHAIISDTAWNSLDYTQKADIESMAKPVVVNIPVIERYGGGGIRCMLAELF